MGVGSKIKEFRNKAGFTQKDLADKLHVTYQAVSRWENDDAEPSIDTIKEMCSILNCSLEELLGMERKDEEKQDEEKVTVVEKVIVQESRPVLGVCEECNRPIYEASDLNRIEESVSVRTGRTSHMESRQKILCNECNEKRLIEEKRKLDEKIKELRRKIKKKRIHSFIWPSLIALIIIAAGINFFVNGNATNGFICLGVSVFAYCFAATMILNNTFITELWIDIALWGFVKLPGIIFEFSIDGFIFLIAMKILFFVISWAVSILAALFATAIAMILSIFAYPLALVRNFKYEQ